MPELVELADRVVDRVEVEVRRDVVGVLVVGRVLHRAEIVDLLPLRDDDHAARVLARRALDAGAGDRKALFLGLVQRAPALFGVFLHVAERGLVRNRRDRAGLEDVFAAEQRLGVAVRAALVFAGKVEVDIRRLVAVEAEERLERDRVSVAVEVPAAARALLRRQVEAREVRAVGDELAVLAVRADVVRLERVDLRNAGHRRDERRADGAAGADEVAVRLAVRDELLRRHVQHREAVLVDGAELARQTLFDDLRQRIAVLLLGARPGDRVELLLGAVDERREHALGNRADLLDHVGDLVRVRHDDLVRLFLSEIFELPQHFVRRAHVQRRLLVGVGEALAGHQDRAAGGVLRVLEVHVARRDDRLVQPLAEPHDRAVVLLELRDVALAVAHHEHVVAERLDLEVIVVSGDLHQLFKRLVPRHRPEQLARLAGRAEDQALTVLVEHAFRRAGALIEVIEVSVGNQLVQVLQADEVLHEDDLVVRRQLLRVAARERRVDVVHALRAEVVAQPLDQIEEDLAEHRRIIRGAVVVERLELQVFRDRVELAVLDVLEHRAAHGDRIDVDVREFHVVPAAGRAQERGVEARVVRDEDRALPAEFKERAHGLFLFRRAPHHFVGDAGQLGDLLRNRLFGVDERVEALGDLAAVDAHRADFGDALGLRRKAGRLEVEADEIRVEPRVRLAGDGGHKVVDKIAFDAVDDLEVAAALFDLEPGVHRVREGLRDAVVGDRNGLLAPLVRLVDEVRGGGHAVHRGHVGM